MTATTIYVAMAEIQVIKGPCAFSVSAIGGGSPAGVGAGTLGLSGVVVYAVLLRLKPKQS